jgi:hypothetical protein
MAGDWIEWAGGECPVGEGVVVEVKYRQAPWESDNAVELLDDATIMRWSHANDNGDIVAYRVVSADAPIASALTTQPGGTHYKECEIQPVQYIEANRLKFLEGCIIKRATRHDKDTGKGREDIEKIIHEAKLILEIRYGG